MPTRKRAQATAAKQAAARAAAASRRPVAKLAPIKLTTTTAFLRLVPILKALDKKYKLGSQLVLTMELRLEKTAQVWSMGIALNGKPVATTTGPLAAVALSKLMNDAQIYLAAQYAPPVTGRVVA